MCCTLHFIMYNILYTSLHTDVVNTIMYTLLYNLLSTVMYAVLDILKVGLISQEHTLVYTQNCTLHYTVSILGRDNRYMVRYSHPPEEIPESKAKGNSRMRTNLFDLISRVVSQYSSISFLKIVILLIPSLISLKIIPYTPLGV